MTMTNKSEIFENLNRQAEKARKEENQLMLALVAACDESLRRDMIFTSNHIAAIIILCQDKNTVNIEKAMVSLFGEGDMIVADMAMEMAREVEYRKKLDSLEKD